MSKLSLVIADLDEKYVRGLSDYINSNHSTAFLVSCFTKPEALTKYLKKQCQADVLLISPDFYDISMSYPNIKLKVMLTGEALDREYPDFHILNKYNTGEKLIVDVVHIYSQRNPFEVRLSPYSKKAELIAVYSPAGGTGKSTIAAALSICCSELGMPSFYLNLESIQTTDMFFDSKGKRNLSYIFYYLKEKSKNLSFRLEGVKNTDTNYGVQYFRPPESPLEYEELDLEELERLLLGIREMGCCDFVYIDMSSAFDTKNHKILDLCDRIVLVNMQEPIAMHKCRVLQNELIKLSETDKECISDKFINVINRCRGKGYEGLESLKIAGSAVIKIPEYSQAFIDEEGRIVIGDEDFRNAINQLIREISGK